MRINEADLPKVITLESVGINLWLAMEFWDCECQEDYMHLETEKQCQICKAYWDDSPSSHFFKVLREYPTIRFGTIQMVDYQNQIQIPLF